MHHRERRTETDIGDSGADRRRGQAALRFLASSVMSTDVRRHLWRGRGPLPRHVWAHVVVEWQMRSHHSPCSSTPVIGQLGASSTLPSPNVKGGLPWRSSTSWRCW